MMLIAVPTLTSSPSQNGSSTSKPAASIQPIMLGVDNTGGSSSRHAVRVFLNSTRFSSAARVPMGTGFAMHRDYREASDDVTCREKASRESPALLAPPQVIDEHLLDWLVVGAQHVPDAVPADQVANLFREVLGVVSGALQRLRHEQHVKAFLALNAIAIFQMPQEDEIAQAVQLGIGAQHSERPIEVTLGERVVHIAQHLLQARRH